MPSKISWCTHTCNWLAGCSHKSPACQHCYAETMTARLARMPNAPDRYQDGVTADGHWTGRISYDPAALHAAFEGLRAARAPRRVFANSMSDTFHPDAPPESLEDLATEIHRCDILTGRPGGWPHVLMLLTKRPEMMAQWVAWRFPAGLPPWVWCGATVEDQRRADERIPHLLRVPAAVRFMSCEPLLGPLWLGPAFGHRECCGAADCDACHGGQRPVAIQWLISGGESGSKARPSHPDWFRSLRDQCRDADVPYHHKQNGEWAPVGRTSSWSGGADIPGKAHVWIRPDGQIGPGEGVHRMARVGKHVAGRLLDGREWNEFPEVIRD